MSNHSWHAKHSICTAIKYALDGSGSLSSTVIDDHDVMNILKVMKLSWKDMIRLEMSDSRLSRSFRSVGKLHVRRSCYKITYINIWCLNQNRMGYVSFVILTGKWSLFVISLFEYEVPGHHHDQHDDVNFTWKIFSASLVEWWARKHKNGEFA